MTLAARLHDLADLADRGELSDVALRGLERALGRAERDAWLTIAAHHCGGAAGLQRLIEAQAWRVFVWLQRGRVPRIAEPALVALYNAIEAGGALPSERHLRRIVSGHEMAEGTGETLS